MSDLTIAVIFTAGLYFSIAGGIGLFSLSEYFSARQRFDYFQSPESEDQMDKARRDFIKAPFWIIWLIVSIIKLLAGR